MRLIRLLTTEFHFHLWQKTMAVFDIYMSVCVHVRSWFAVPLISGFKVSKQIVFGMDTLGWISSWRKSEQKKRKIKYTRARACRFTERDTDREVQRDRQREKQPTGKQPPWPGLAGVLCVLGGG